MIALCNLSSWKTETSVSGGGGGDWWYTERNISSVISILIVLPMYSLYSVHSISSDFSTTKLLTMIATDYTW